tara:strand:+ start:751 stop:1425 length:675 start_codon:yes stop_codon:yes gene_type:complete
MSIVVLKKKVNNGGNPRNSPISGNSTLGFALNGTRRIGPQIYVNLGNYYYPNPEYINTCINNPNVIKKSVMNTKGMLSSRKVNSNPCCKEWVQPEYNNLYLQTLSSSCNVNYSDCSNNMPINTICKDNNNYLKKCNTCGKSVSQANNYGVGKNYLTTNTSKNVSGNMSSSEYLSTNYLKNKNIPVPRTYENAINEKLSFPPAVNNSGCNKNYINQKTAAKNGIY